MPFAAPFSFCSCLAPSLEHFQSFFSHGCCGAFAARQKLRVSLAAGFVLSRKRTLAKAVGFVHFKLGSVFPVRIAIRSGGGEIRGVPPTARAWGAAGALGVLAGCDFVLLLLPFKTQKSQGCFALWNQYYYL